jgi:hypothetical protein
MKIFICSLQPNEARVPVTVRVQWLPDGKIKPLAYWTPDNSCYTVTHIYNSVKLAFLKERGEGIRFKIKAEVSEATDSYGRFALRETYLYLADNRFCEKDFIDGRYGHDGKLYVPVVLDIFPTGDYELIYFNIGDTRYMVEKTVAVAPRGSFHAGGIGIRHKVEARLVNATDNEDPDPNKSIRRLAALYRELNKWFVAVNV